MIKKITIRQIHTNSLSCEPLIERMPNGELLCVCQCDGTHEPAPENRVYVWHSKDNGESWSERKSIYPEDGQAVYCTELSVQGDEITAYLTVHTGRFLDWKCYMMKSFDNGYTWKNYGNPPFFPEYTFIRGTFRTSDGRILIPYQHYDISREEHDRILATEEDKLVCKANNPGCESGVLESCDNGQTYRKNPACLIVEKDVIPDKAVGTYDWIWTEPTLAELSDGTIAMLMRADGSGWLYRCDSADGGHTWCNYYRTDIPNPGNKPRLIQLDNSRIALIHTPNNQEVLVEGKKGLRRFPLELWISDDDMKTWSSKTVLTDFPGQYSYADGFYEDGHIHFVIEHNRHTILYFDVTL